MNRIAIVMVGVLLAGIPMAARAEATSPVASIVPDSTTVFLQLRNPGETLDVVRDSPVLATIRAILEERGKGEEATAWLDEFERGYGLPIEEVFRGVAGAEIALALRFREEGESDGGIFLRGPDAARAEEIFERIRRGDLELGNQVAEPDAAHRGVMLYVKERSRGDRVKREWSALIDGTIAVSEQRSFLVEAIDLARGGTEGRLSDHTRFNRAAAELGGAADAFLFVDGPGLYRAVPGDAIRAAHGRVRHRIFARSILDFLAALDYVAVGLERDENGWRWRCKAPLRDEDLSDFMRDRLAQSPGESRVVGRLPAGTLLVSSHRIDPARRWNELLEAAGEERAGRIRERARLFWSNLGGGDFESDVLPNLGPELTVALLPPSDAAGEGLHLPALTLWVEVRDAERVRPQIDAVLERGRSTLQFFAALAAVDGDGGPRITFGSRAAAGGEVHYASIEGTEIPAGLSPGHAWVGDFLVLGTNADALVALSNGSGSGGLSGSDRFRAAREGALWPAHHFGYIDVEGIAAWAESNAAALTAEEDDPARARRDLADVLRLLDHFPYVAGGTRCTPEGIEGRGRLRIE